MARTALTDVLQVFPFWLMDVAPIEPLALPLFTPLFGFASASAPEISMGVEEINEGNWHFSRKVLKRGSISNIVLTRGTTFYDADFYRWIVAAISGNTGGTVSGTGAIGGPTPRRDLLLIHNFARNPFGTTEAAAAAISLGLASVAGGVSRATFGGGFDASGINATAAAGTLAGIAMGAATAAPGPFQFAARLPARAFLLHGCLPVRYKVGTDFDASSNDVSMKELEITVEAVDEISLTS